MITNHRRKTLLLGLRAQAVHRYRNDILGLAQAGLEKDFWLLDKTPPFLRNL